MSRRKPKETDMTAIAFREAPAIMKEVMDEIVKMGVPAFGMQRRSKPKEWRELEAAESEVFDANA